MPSTQGFRGRPRRSGTVARGARYDDGCLHIVSGIGQVEALVGEQVTIPGDGGMTVAYPPRAAERRPRPAAAAGVAMSSSSSTWPVSTSVMIRRATASNSATTGLVSE